MARKNSYECGLGGSRGGEAGNPGEDSIIAEAAKRATTMFVEELKKAGIQPVTEAGGFDRGGCGHDRS